MTADTNAHVDRWPFLQGLPFRVVAFLSLALLPIGLLAIWQTQNLDDTLRARTELSLYALSESSASGERQTLQRALGAARGQAATYPLMSGDAQACSMAFKALQRSDPSISFAGFLPLDGRIECSSNDGPLDIVPTSPVMAIADATRSTLVPRLRDDEVDGTRNVAVLTQPVMQDGAAIGQIVLSLPTDTLSDVPDLDTVTAPLSLNIFNRDGDIIVGQGEAPTSGKVAIADFAMPADGVLKESFVGTNAQGERRVYVVLTLVPDLAYAVAGWATSEGFLAANVMTLPSFFLPAMMWLASLLVAYFAVHRLVVSPVKDLGDRMRRFASDRSLTPPRGGDLLPQELYDLEQTFANMAYDLLDDGARMEDALREKNILLKEVHHRVKNNLQMISSIMNMQIRTATSAESRAALRRLQDRVLGLATAHRLLYQSKDLAKADAAPLLTDLCAPIFALLKERHPDAVHRLTVDNFGLIPDQAVPLALLTGELGMYAVLTMPDRPDQPPVLEISLQIIAPGIAQFRCRNSVGAPEAAMTGGDGGVGLQLIRAFALQLGGAIDRLQQGDLQVVTIEFPITAAIPDALDY